MNKESFINHAKAWEFTEGHERDRESGIVAEARTRAAEAGLPQSSAAQGAMVDTLLALVGASSAIVVGTDVLVETAQIIEGFERFSPSASLHGTIGVTGPHSSVARVTTVDSSPQGIAEVRRFFNAVGNRTSAILRAVNADPRVYLTRLNADDYDLLLVSGDPDNYTASFAAAPRLLHRGGVLVFTDVLAMGDDASSEGVVNAADRSAKAVAMRALLDAVEDDERFSTALLPVGSGILVAALR
ncbi:O-methyltransferase [Bifidobacterium choloepi]|uniref:Methyltransferase n=1 Tax=Bifidobacterium choloepi TaxID=2614131 RepID=A0A6I5NN76_9BIFI|nr:methyltransferase [Bifidobacterium choloepi]NEG70172.1 methyltransferase [Bifidobacterium choloepi]